MRDKSKSFIPTEIGVLVNNVLTKHFPDIVDYKFTSQIEEKLDDIAKGKLDWVNMVGEFYEPFKDNLEKKYVEVSKEDLAPVVKTKEKCPKCSKSLMGKPKDEEGKVKIRAKEYVCPECGYTAEKDEYEKGLTANIKYICPHCKFEGEKQIPFIRKKVRIPDEKGKNKSIDSLRFQCGKCGKDIDITKKMK